MNFFCHRLFSLFCPSIFYRWWLLIPILIPIVCTLYNPCIHTLFSRFCTLLCALVTVNTAYTIYFFLIRKAQTAFPHCTFSFITAHFVHHCTLKQALNWKLKVKYHNHLNDTETYFIQQEAMGIFYDHPLQQICQPRWYSPDYRIRLVSTEDSVDASKRSFPLLTPATNVPSNFCKSLCAQKFPVCNISPALIYILNDMHEICAKTFIKENICALKVFLYALISRPVCARAQLRGNIANYYNSLEAYNLLPWKRKLAALNA